MHNSLNEYNPTPIFVTPLTSEYVCYFQDCNITDYCRNGLFEMSLNFFGSYFIIPFDNVYYFIIYIIIFAITTEPRR